MNVITVFLVLVVLAAAVGAVALAAGPASGFARGYVDRLEQATKEDPGAAGATAATTAVRVRSRGLLERRPQGVLAALLCAATLAWGLSRGVPADTVIALPVVALLGVAGSVDAVCHRLPDRLLGSAALWLIVALAGRSLVRLVTMESAQAALWPAGRAVLCALGAGAVVFVMWLIPFSGMGLGDVKLCALLGLWLGYTAVEYVVTGLFLGFMLAGFAAIGLLITRRAGRKDMIAFGPYLAVGGWLTWLLAVA
ncbi:A24 family peptidase [Actinomyces sp.]|uniref:prepilin peptidase n=1 Tax=Actinomyces sp. TaxID=29317 RepID=UPI0026DDA316|nr:A24 family peptidase [Actinomyces sp.]MDO4900553.1 A24 family peptidase [Actinomyces sp.]